MAQRVDDVMIEVMKKLQCIVKHLQKFELNETCNRMAKGTNDIIEAFMEAAVRLSHEQMEIEIDNGEILENPLRNPALSKGPSELSLRQRNTWARIAKAGLESRPGIPSSKVTLPIDVAYALQQTTSLSSGGSVHAEAKTIQPKASTVTVVGPFPHRNVNLLTSKIHEGPLYEIKINLEDGCAKITFQHATQATNLIEHDQAMHKRHGYGAFGPGYLIVDVVEFEWDAEIRRMAGQYRESRRLTFAKSRLFGPHMSFVCFQEIVTGVAGGPDTIDIAWAYNSGNATFVFQSVRVARAVKKHFMAQSAHNGPFKNLQITFSTDPCEKPMILGTSTPPNFNDAAGNNDWMTGQRTEGKPMGMEAVTSQPEVKLSEAMQPSKAQPVDGQAVSVKPRRRTRGRKGPKASS